MVCFHEIKSMESLVNCAYSLCYYLLMVSYINLITQYDIKIYMFCIYLPTLEYINYFLFVEPTLKQLSTSYLFFFTIKYSLENLAPATL